MNTISGNGFVIYPKQTPKRSELKKQLYKLLFARSDLGAAREACDLFIDKVDNIVHPLYYPLYASMVVCYIRPFTNNKPYGGLPKRFSKFPDDKLKDLHRNLLKARHELIAHSDITHRRALIFPPKSKFGEINGKDLHSSGIGTAVNISFYAPEIFPKFRGLIIFNLDRIKKEIDELTNRLYQGMSLPNRKFDLKINEGL